jgi:hypothetical protein
VRTHILINLPVTNQGIVNMIRRHARIEVEHGIRIVSCMLEKVLWNHSHLPQFLVSLIENTNQHGFLSTLFSYVMGKLESSTSKSVYRDNISFVEPKPDRGVELTLNCVLARYLWHSLSVPVMARMFLAPVLPLGFPLLNLCVRHRNDALCEPLKTLKWGFWLRRHVRKISRISISANRE